MVGIKNNRRVQQTRNQLKLALLTLLADHSLANITVTTICQVADINRGTFYSHYDNPAALFADIEHDLAQQVSPLIGDETTLMTWLPQVLTVIKQQDTATAIILQNLQHSPVLQTILKPMRHQTLSRYSARFDITDPAVLNYYFEFYFSGAIQVISQWLATGAKETPQQIAEIIDNVTEFNH
ncbi:TetR/AcrR family transcriptional regulator [Lacticaseibacillus porcinae]|uniref:TetR/AcrR family transcriptional regulator n=1 Tax=Lacticaseibacillus porcinae TaxID=1123687 RepID=UPI000F782BDD|nr:TetR/AcrR family transcriptional regulator [Lacticaseibacillus porcinae]